MLPSAIRLGNLRRNTLSWCRRTRISACSAIRDRTRPTTAHQIKLHKSLIATILSRFAGDRHQGWVCGRDNVSPTISKFIRKLCVSVLSQKRTCPLYPEPCYYWFSRRSQMLVAVRALIIASGVVLTVGSIATAMPVAHQPHFSQDMIQIHGCHHGYSHDLGGWHRHGKDCQRLRGIVGRKNKNKSQEKS